ncbi:MAG: hypothetical protein LBK12_00840 [Odoribacteraceae bacterium]|jgi:hypothetical protein|nr:hypothetical protein [Odoribacteraceae bacterium]
MMKHRHSCAVCLLIACLPACTKSDKVPTIKEILSAEKARIHVFLQGKNYTAIPHEATYYGEPLRDTIYVLDNDATGKTATNGQFVLVDYDEMAFNGMYIASTDPARFIGEGLKTPYPYGGPVCIETGPLPDGTLVPFARAIREISEGTTGEVILPSTLAGRGAGDYFYGRVRVHRVIPDILAYEKTLVDAYLDTLRAGGATDDDIFAESVGDSTSYVVVTHCHATAGDSIAAFAEVKIAYTIYLMNEAALVTPPTCLKRKIKEVAEDAATFQPVSAITPYLKQHGLTRLKKGDEATLVIPFAISRDAVPDLGLPPYSTLVYRLEIVDLK